ncbi:hypothetical protein LguiB_015521 [Lonicera macranthoides]
MHAGGAVYFDFLRIQLFVFGILSMLDASCPLFLVISLKIHLLLIPFTGDTHE